MSKQRVNMNGRIKRAKKNATIQLANHVVELFNTYEGYGGPIYANHGGSPGQQLAPRKAVRKGQHIAIYEEDEDGNGQRLITEAFVILGRVDPNRVLTLGETIGRLMEQLDALDKAIATSSEPDRTRLKHLRNDLLLNLCNHYWEMIDLCVAISRKAPRVATLAMLCQKH